MKKRILKPIALLLAVVMLMGMLPISALESDLSTPSAEQKQEVHLYLRADKYQVPEGSSIEVFNVGTKSLCELTKDEESSSEAWTIYKAMLPIGDYNISVKQNGKVVGSLDAKISEIEEWETEFRLYYSKIAVNDGFKAGEDYTIAALTDRNIDSGIIVYPYLAEGSYYFFGPRSTFSGTAAVSEAKKAEYYKDKIFAEGEYLPDVSGNVFSIEFAKELPKSFDVNVSYQSANQFHIMPKTIKVTKGIAKSYGYENALPIAENDISTLDVLVAMHEDLFGKEAFTKETAKDVLVVKGGMISKMFGTESSSVVFTVNGKCPNDGVFNDKYNAYTGYLVNQAKIGNGDKVEFFQYGDSYWGDNYTWFEKDGTKLESAQIKAGEKIALALKGYPIGFYGFSKDDLIAKVTKHIANAAICIADESGNLTKLEGITTDEKGEAAISFDTAGEKIISAVVTVETGSGKTPIISPIARLTVSEKLTYPQYENKVYDDFQEDLWLQYDFKALDVGQTAEIFPRRVPQAITNTTQNDVERPNFNFEVVEGDSIELSTFDSTDKCIVKAVKPGIAVVMVSYDEFTHKTGKVFPACSKVNTGYIVYAVGEDGSIVPSTSIKQSSYDTLYFSEGESTSLEFDVLAEGAKSYSVTCNGEGLVGKDNHFSAPLKNRSNIIGVTAIDESGKQRSIYKVVDARKIEIKIDDSTPSDGYFVGDTLKVSFNGITPPVYKLATIYNPTWSYPTGGSYGTYVHYENTQLNKVQGAATQWDLAKDNTITLKPTEAGKYNFTNGGIYSQWWGKPIGYDKTSNAAGGSSGGMAATNEGEFSQMPSFTIDIAPKEAPEYPTSVELDKAKAQINSGETLTLVASVKPFNTKNSKLTWSSSEPNVASVDQNGKVTALTSGKTTIKAESGDKKAWAACEIEVFAVGGNQPGGKNSVSISIDKLTINGGYVLNNTTVEIDGSTSVWDITKSVLDKNSISYKHAYSSKYGSVYISEIDGDGEFDHGEGSGWMYSVNGSYPKVGSSSYKLSNGDVVRWRYTTNYGVDIGDVGSLGGNPPSETQSKNSTTLDVGSSINGKTASASVSSSELSSYIAKASEKAKESGKTSELEINMTKTANVQDIRLVIAKEAIAEMGKSQNNISLRVTTEIGSMLLDRKTIENIAKNTGEDACVIISKVNTETLSDKEKHAVKNNSLYELKILAGSKELTTFGDGTITMYIPYVLKTGEKAKGMEILYFAPNGALEPVKSQYDESSKMMMGTTTHLSRYLIAYNEVKLWENHFSDVKAEDWHYNSVGFANMHKLLLGTGNAKFEPNADMNRAMFATMLSRIGEYDKGFEIKTNDVDIFKDIDNSSWYSKGVKWSGNAGVFSGDRNGMFKPMDSITREQIAVSLYNYAKLIGMDVSVKSDISTFKDADNISAWAKQAVTWAYEKQIIKGRDNTLSPLAAATRAEACAMVERFIKAK